MSDQPPPYEPYQPYPEDSARREAEVLTHEAAPERPASLKNAVRLMWAGAGLSVLYLVVSLAMLHSLKDDIRDELRSRGESFTQSDIDTAYQVAIVSLVVFGVIGIALWVWMALMNGRGRNWARITATVFGGLNIVINVLGLTGASTTSGASIVGVLFSVANLIIAVGALVFMYRKDASAYYAAMSRR